MQPIHRLITFLSFVIIIAYLCLASSCAGREVLYSQKKAEEGYYLIFNPETKLYDTLIHQP